MILTSQQSLKAARDPIKNEQELAFLKLYMSEIDIKVVKPHVALFRSIVEQLDILQRHFGAKTYPIPSSALAPGDSD